MIDTRAILEEQVLQGMKRAPETAKHSLEISALSAQRKNI